MNKYFNDAIIGNKDILASYTNKGELLRLYYPTKDYRQLIETFSTGIKINDSNLIKLESDINNTYDQYYTEDTNILNTEITNTYFNLKILQKDFIPISHNLVCKSYTLENLNTIHLNAKFLLHSNLLSDENESVSGWRIENGLLQYSHNYTFGILSDQEAYSHKINDVDEKIIYEDIFDKDYIGMSENSCIEYDIGIIKPKEKKTINIYLWLHENAEKETIPDLEKQISQVLKIDTKTEEANTAKYWKKYLKDHNGIDLKIPESKYEEEVQKIYKRTILLFPLLTNQNTGGMIASVEIDEKKTKCGRYAYCWPRDAVFITKAMDILKMEKDTERFYKTFCKNTQLENGMWEQRYYTDGKLAPCWGYQIDETASVVYGVYKHFQRTKDIKFLSATLKMCENAVKYLKTYVENMESEIKVSYDLWEMHEGIHLYSLSTIFAAFTAMLHIYKELEETFQNNRIKKEKVKQEEDVLKKYQLTLKNYILDNMYDESKKSFVRGIKSDIIDISILGSVIPFGVFSLNEKKIQNTIENINLNLRTYTGGYLRFEKDHYIGGQNPWPIATLWMALYYLEIGDKKQAKDCFDFVVKSVSEHGFIAEQIDNQTLKPAWVNALRLGTCDVYISIGKNERGSYMTYQEILIIIVLVAIVILIYMKNHIRKKTIQKYGLFRQAPEIDPAAAGYLYNKNVDGFSLILAELLVLVKKGYLGLELIKDENGKNDYVFTKLKDDLSGLKNYEALAYRSIFENFTDNKVHLNEFAEKIKKHSQLAMQMRAKTFSIKQTVIEQLEKEGLAKRRAIYSIKTLLVLCVIFPFLLFRLGHNSAMLALTSAITSIIFLLLWYKKMNSLTDYGIEQNNQTYGYARFLKENKLFKDREISQVVLWEDAYIYAVAFHIPLKGIVEFIGDEVEYRENVNLGKYFLKIAGVPFAMGMLFFLIEFLSTQDFFLSISAAGTIFVLLLIILPLAGTDLDER